VFSMIMDGEIVCLDLCLLCAKAARLWTDRPGKTRWAVLKVA